eukprot:UN18201
MKNSGPHLLTKHAKILGEGKSLVKKRHFFHEVSKVEGDFTSNQSLSLIIA